MNLRAAPMLLGLVIAALAAGVVLGVVIWRETYNLTSPAGYAQPDPKTFTYTETPRTAAGLDFQEIAFAAPDGRTVRGWLVPAAGDAKDLGVVALHGRGGDRRGALAQLPIFHGEGAGVALIDMRENGLSDGKGRGIGLAVRESEDAVAAAEDLRRRGYRKIVVFGCSLGASAAVLAAARDPAIDGVIAESTLGSFESFKADGATRRLARFGLRAPWVADAWGRAVVAVTRWRIGLQHYERPFDVVDRIAPRPILLIHGERDPWAWPEHARTLARVAGPNATLMMVPQGGHCDDMAVAPAEYRARIVELLKKAAPR